MISHTVTSQLATNHFTDWCSGWAWSMSSHSPCAVQNTKRPGQCEPAPPAFFFLSEVMHDCDMVTHMPHAVTLEAVTAALPFVFTITTSALSGSKGLTATYAARPLLTKISTMGRSICRKHLGCTHTRTQRGCGEFVRPGQPRRGGTVAG